MPMATAASRWSARWRKRACAARHRWSRRWRRIVATANDARRAIWFAWLVLIAAVGWGVARHLQISSDLRDFVPPARTADQKLLLDEIGKGPGSRLLLLAISGAPQDRLAALSRGLQDALSQDPAFAQAANGGNDLAEIASDLLP